MSDELDKSEGDKGEEGTEGGERPTVSPPFDPAAFARDVLSSPSPARGTPAAKLGDAHTHATPPQGMAQQAAAVELSRASNPPNEAQPSSSVAPSSAGPDSIRSLAAKRLPSNELPRIEPPDSGPKKTESLSTFNAVDREWAELEIATRPPPPNEAGPDSLGTAPPLAPPPVIESPKLDMSTSPPPADAPDEDPVLEVSHEPGGMVNLDLDDIEHLEAPTRQRDKLPSMTNEVTSEASAEPQTTPLPVEKAPSKKPPPGEREMNDRVSVGDYSGALEIAEAILAEKPNDTAARACAENCRTVLRKMYAARIGPLDRVPSVAVARDQLRWLSIDHKAGFVLSLVDGVSSLEMIIDVSGMPELDTLRILSELAQQRIISLR